MNTMQVDYLEFIRMKLAKNHTTRLREQKNSSIKSLAMIYVRKQIKDYFHADILAPL